jgi:hypothetical protein
MTYLTPLRPNLATDGALGDRRTGAVQGAQVGHGIRVDRCRDADDHRSDSGERRGLGGEGERGALGVRGEALVVALCEVRVTVADGVEPVRVGFDSDDRAARGDERERQGKPT